MSVELNGVVGVGLCTSFVNHSLGLFLVLLWNVSGNAGFGLFLGDATGFISVALIHDVGWGGAVGTRVFSI